MRQIVNSGLLGGTVKIRLRGFDGEGETTPVHYIDTGEGETLLFIHAPGQSLYTFRELIPCLEKKYRCVAVDLPGFGFSGRPVSYNFSMRETGEAIVLIAEALGIKKAHLVGASLGSLYALEAAKMEPETFEKLLLFCPGGITKQMPRMIRLMAAPVIGPVARELYGKSGYYKTLRTAYYDATLCTDEIAAEYYKTSDDYASRQAFMYALRNFDPGHAYRGADRLYKETFLLWGAEDRWQPFTNSASARDAMPLSYCYKVENAGHFFWEEKAAVTADMADKFFRYVPEEEEEEENAE